MPKGHFRKTDTMTFGGLRVSEWFSHPDFSGVAIKTTDCYARFVGHNFPVYVAEEREVRRVEWHAGPAPAEDAGTFEIDAVELLPIGDAT